MIQNNKLIFLIFTLIFVLKSVKGFSNPDHLPVKIASYGRWSVFYYTENGNKVCFTKSNPVDKITNHNQVSPKREPFIAFSIFDRHKIEFYTNFDYGLRLNSNPVLSTGNGSFYLLSTEVDYGQIAYLSDELSEADLMNKAIDGNYIYIFSRSMHNTYSVDMYSINGLDKAFDRMKKECNFKECCN